jgi:hypothetical protein
VEYARGNEMELPKEVSRGIVKIGSLELEVIQLDNGMRITTEESIKQFCEWLESAGPQDVIEAKAIFG